MNNVGKTERKETIMSALNRRRRGMSFNEIRGIVDLSAEGLEKILDEMRKERLLTRMGGQFVSVLHHGATALVAQDEPEPIKDLGYKLKFLDALSGQYRGADVIVKDIIAIREDLARAGGAVA